MYDYTLKKGILVNRGVIHKLYSYQLEQVLKSIKGIMLKNVTFILSQVLEIITIMLVCSDFYTLVSDSLM